MIYKISLVEDNLDTTYLMIYKISLVKDNLDTIYLMIYKISLVEDNLDLVLISSESLYAAPELVLSTFRNETSQNKFSGSKCKIEKILETILEKDNIIFPGLSSLPEISSLWASNRRSILNSSQISVYFSLLEGTVQQDF